MKTTGSQVGRAMVRFGTQSASDSWLRGLAEHRWACPVAVNFVAREPAVGWVNARSGLGMKAAGTVATVTSPFWIVSRVKTVLASCLCEIINTATQLPAQRLYEYVVAVLPLDDARQHSGSGLEIAI